MVREIVILSKASARPGCPTKAPCPILSPRLRKGGIARTFAVRFSLTAFAFWSVFVAVIVQAQAPATSPAAPTAVPIAIVPIDTRNPDQGAKVTGALEVSQGKAIIASSGEVTSGSATTQVTLPRRGTLRVCASTTVKLAADSSVPAGEVPGLLMALDRGAVEASFAAGRNSDILLTPSLRVLIGGPGAVDLKVRLAENGDTCVDNPGLDAPYVLVSSVFDGGAYRVQPGQRVMFQHGSLNEVVDQEKEPCGCPPPSSASPAGNEFPLAQSEGLAPMAKPLSAPPPGSPATQGATQGTTEAQSAPPLVYNTAANAPKPPPEFQAASTPAAPATPVAQKKPGFLHKVGNFFRRIFGADS